MKKVVMFNTSYGTHNLGDFIINNAIKEEMGEILSGSFVVNYGTHNPILRFTQNLKKNPISEFCKKADYKFLCGTNLFSKSLDHLTPNFNINIVDSKNYLDSVSLGCGVGNTSSRTSVRTKYIYRKILSKKYYHSTRDEETKIFLESLGVKAINTGCPTMWKLTKEFCSSIPTKKSDKVVFTLTDYDKDVQKDQELINILNNNYKKVYYWIQGTGDYDYFKSLDNIDDIEIIEPSVEAYEKILDKGGLDYVGTRLHAGICAMRHGVRSIIVAIDNRVRDMKKTYNLITVERDNIVELKEMINEELITAININEENIKEWKAQFEADIKA